MLKLRPTFEQIEKEARTHRLKILPERQKRTQQGISLDDVNFDDFDLSNYDKKALILIDNPDKGTQTDLFETKTSSEKSESIKSLGDETFKSEETENEPMQEQERQREQPERERGKSIVRRMYDAMFADDEYREEREELLRNRRAQTDASADALRGIRDEEQEEEQEQIGEEQVEEEDDDEVDLSMNVKKSFEASSSSSGSRRSSTNRSALLPIEEEALSEHIQPSPPVSVQSSMPSIGQQSSSSRQSIDGTIEYVESQTPVQSVISSRRSQETIEYIRSRSSRGS